MRTPRFTKTGPKRLRRTRRELPEGQFSQYGTCATHFKREREVRLHGTRRSIRAGRSHHPRLRRSTVSRPTYTTEDGVLKREGEIVYNYYDMRPVLIGRANSQAGWFTAHCVGDTADTYGGSDLLNGARVCTIEFAERRGFQLCESDLAELDRLQIDYMCRHWPGVVAGCGGRVSRAD